MKKLLTTGGLVWLFLVLFPLMGQAETIQMGKLVQGNVPYYKEANLTQSVGTLNQANMMVSFTESDIKGFVSISMGGDKFLVSQSMIQPISNPVPVVAAESGKRIETKATFKIYSGPTEKSAVLATGQGKHSFVTSGYQNGYFIINVAGQVGYVNWNYANIVFSVPTGSIEVLQDGVPLYEVKNRTRTRIGTLNKGTVFKRSRQIENWHQIERNGRVYQVQTVHTFPSSKEAIVKAIPKPRYPAYAMTEMETPIINGSGAQIGTLKPGFTVGISSVKNKLGYIDYMGSLAYVPMKNVKHVNLIQPKKNMSHQEMSYWLSFYSNMYPEFTKLELIGRSVEGKGIYAMKVGTGKKEIVMDASMHAREHITTNVLMEMMDTYSTHYVNKTSYAGYNVRQALDRTSIWFIPMMNPDGVTLVQGGKNAVKNGALATRINGSTNFARWKANVRGVDLNDNFDSGWSVIDSAVKKPNYMGYRGPRVYSEPESVALKNFVEKHDFKSYISYHSAGQVLYWFMFQQEAQLARDIQYVNQLRAITGYTVMSPLYKRGSGASTDWFIQRTKNPAVTVEVGPYTGEQPVPLVYWDRIWTQNHKVGLHAANEAWNRK